MGREALEARRHRPPKKWLACFTVDDPAVVLLGGETIFRDGERVGWLTSGGWGYTVGANIGYGYVRNSGGVTGDYLEAGSYALEAATGRVPCAIRMRALYDPKSARVRD